ncbi:MAG: hypothetical protein HFJ27_06215 [Clostridia bacterium]|nr:hypothetical protein [Clostridia bacterium]
MIQLEKRQILIGIGIIIAMIGIIGYYFYTKFQNTEEEFISISEENNIQNETITKQENQEQQIIIHIAGEVKNPGVIRTIEGARIADIIRRSTED